MGRRKVHLTTKPDGKVACGTRKGVRQTRNPAGVTCDNCQRTLHMIDAEIRRNPRTVPTSE